MVAFTSIEGKQCILPVIVFKVILIMLSSTGQLCRVLCILQYSSTHRLQCTVYTLHWLTIEAGDLINIPVSGYYKLSSDCRQWDVYIRHQSSICLANGAHIKAWLW